MDELFAFALDMGAGESCMTEKRLEDTIYNCLDFCMLCAENCPVQAIVRRGRKGGA